MGLEERERLQGGEWKQNYSQFCFILNSGAVCYFHVICIALHVHYLLQYNPMRPVFVSLFPR